MFRKLHLFPSSIEKKGEYSYSVGSVIETSSFWGAQLSRCLLLFFIWRRKQSSFRNVVLLLPIIRDKGKFPKPSNSLRYDYYVYNYVKKTTFQISALVIGQEQLHVKCYRDVTVLCLYICFNLHKCHKRIHVVMLELTSILQSET
jgi:hypothetical protein